MIKPIFALIGAPLICSCASPAGFKTKPVHPAAQAPQLITQYFDRLDAVFRDGSTKDDIHDFLALMSDDVRYIHREYDADFTLTSWRAAFLRISANGGYNQPAEFCTAVTNIIAGKSHYAVEYKAGTTIEDGCEAEESPPKLAIFTLDEQSIRRIEELW